MNAAVRLYLLGGFRLENAQGEVLSVSLRKAEALLAYVALAPGKTASREKLATLLWGESDQQRARQSLRQALFALTRAFARAELVVLRMESQMVSLDPKSIWVDADEFQQLVAQGDAGSLARATASYDGGLLQDFAVDSPDFDEWLISVRSRLEETALRAFVDLLDLQQAAEDTATAIETAQGALRIDAYREDIHRRLMELYMACGMRSSALHQYRQCREFLERELGVPPDEETTALYKRILDQGPRNALETEPDHAPQADEPERRPRQEPVLGHPVVAVGREDELGVLLDRLAAAKQGECRLVVTTGESGVGKTHLLDRFVEAAGARHVAILNVRGRRSERGLAYGLWIELLSALPAAEPSDPEWDRLTRDILRRLQAGDSDGSKSGVHGRPDHYELFESVVEVLRRTSSRQPVAVVIDDLHWVDEESLALIAFALRKLEGTAVLFLAAVGSDDLAGGQRLSEMLSDLEEDGLAMALTVQPLSLEETTELARRLREASGDYGDQPADVEDVWSLSEGNPQIVVDLLGVRADRRQGGKHGSDPLPGRIFADVAQRLAPLGQSARGLADVASVIGDHVDFDVLRRASGLKSEAATSGLEALVGAGLLTPRGERFAFVRQRDRVALYYRLLAPRRRALHGAVADAILAIHGGELELHYQELARHCHGTGDAAKALGFEIAQGYYELRRGAQGAARRAFRGALKTAKELSTKQNIAGLEIDARLGLGLCAEVEQDLDTADSIFESLESRLRHIADERQRLTILIALSRTVLMRGDEERAYAHARRALAEAEKGSGDCIWPLADCLLFRLHMINGVLDPAVEKLVAQQERAHALGLYEDETAVASALGILYALRGDFEPATAACRRAVQVAERVGDERCLAAALQFCGMVEMWQGRQDAALLDFEKAAGVAADRGDLFRLYSLTGHRGFALAADKHYDEALAAFSTALDMAERLNTKLYVPLFTAWMAEASFEAGAHDEALDLGRKAAHLAAEANQTWARSIALRTLARVMSHPDVRDLEGAQKSIRSAIDDQEGLGIKFEKARSMVVQAKILRAVGNMRKSSAVYGEASTMFEQMHMTSEFDSARNMAQALRPGDESE